MANNTRKAATLPANALYAKGPKALVSQQDYKNWLNQHCGGNPANATIVLLPNCTGANPLPFARMGSPTNNPSPRAQILWLLVNGVKVNGATSRNLATFLQAAGAIGMAKGNPLDLFAALNGGYSTKPSTSGQPFAYLVPNAPAKPKASKPKAVAKAPQPAAPALPAPQAPATPAAPAPATNPTA